MVKCLKKIRSPSPQIPRPRLLDIERQATTSSCCLLKVGLAKPRPFPIRTDYPDPSKSWPLGAPLTRCERVAGVLVFAEPQDQVSQTYTNLQQIKYPVKPEALAGNDTS